jgi:hypothetical protein
MDFRKQIFGKKIGISNVGREFRKWEKLGIFFAFEI